MSHANDDAQASPTSLTDLLTRFLQQRAAAHAAGTAFAQPAGEVEPHEAAPAQPVDARLALDEAVAVVRFYDSTGTPRKWTAPADWSNLVVASEPAAALAFCVGNFPQLVRNVQPLLHPEGLKRLAPNGGRSLALPGLLAWVAAAEIRKQVPEALLAAGALRLARNFESAATLLKEIATAAPASWQAALANEQAALAWHRGQTAEAARLWQAQADSVPVRFNRGMAALFLGQKASARTELHAAVAQLPEDSSWHHLGRLYLALAESR
jgi:tetratricopeptide (TPR) repeat protein